MPAVRRQLRFALHYTCVIDSHGIAQIKLGDCKFADLIKRFEGANNRVFGVNAFGYLDLGKAGSPTHRTLTPKRKCQDGYSTKTAGDLFVF